jgi:hypothetical protein
VTLLRLVRTVIRCLQMSACAFLPEDLDSMQISLFAHLGEGAPIILGDRPDHIGLKRNMGPNLRFTSACALKT